MVHLKMTYSQTIIALRVLSTPSSLPAETTRISLASETKACREKNCIQENGCTHFRQVNTFV